jgi:two-component system response regulator DevR
MLTVYLADDSKAVRERMAALVDEIEGVELIGQAEDAPQAVEGIQLLKPDVAIVDIQMPGGNGLKVLEAAKQVEPVPWVIILTAFPTEQHRCIYLGAGADGFFDKAKEFHLALKLLMYLRDFKTSGKVGLEAGEGFHGH